MELTLGSFSSNNSGNSLSGRFRIGLGRPQERAPFRHKGFGCLCRQLRELDRYRPSHANENHRARGCLYLCVLRVVKENLQIFPRLTPTSSCCHRFR